MKTLKALLISIVAVIVVTAFVIPQADAQNLRRLSAEYQLGEISTAVEQDSGGVLVYSKTISSANANDTLFVTIVGTSDLHFGSVMSFACSVDGVQCNPNYEWVRVQKLPIGGLFNPNCGDGGGGAGDCHDNSFTVTWCTAPLPNTPQNLRTVTLKMASDDGQSGDPDENRVFYERAHIYIDAARLTSNNCLQAFQP